MSLRGATVAGGPAGAIVIFERNRAPWTKSVMRTISAAREAARWRQVVIPFLATESYAANEAMLSLRLALEPQTIELGGVRLVNLGQGKDAEALRELDAQLNPLGEAHVTIDARDERQTLQAFGGNFCQGRYGHREMLDAVGQHALATLSVGHARVGIPFDTWSPARGVYRDEGPAHGVLLLVQELTRRRIPITASIWTAPEWMVTDPKPDVASFRAPPNASPLPLQCLLAVTDNGSPPLTSFRRVLVNVAGSSTNEAGVTGGLIGNWKLDEGAGPTTADATTNNVTGTLDNGTIWTNGQSGRALSFDDVN